MTDTDDTAEATDPLDGVNPEHVLAITRWATKHGATAVFAGTCGFGRECVGIGIGGNYLDYSHLYDLFRHNRDLWAQWWAPEDAYHKHDCMAVLGRGPAAVEQLHQWVTWLDEHGWTVREDYREPTSHLDAVWHGLSTPKLMPPDTGEVLVWSHQRGAWWKAGEHGYTTDLAEAGRYTATRALEICRDANLGEWAGGLPNEVMIEASSVNGASEQTVRHLIDEATRAMQAGRAAAEGAEG